MSDIKAGDLVMVVRPNPCCKDLGVLSGVVSVAHNPHLCLGRCLCGAFHFDPVVEIDFRGNRERVLVSRLIKIDPPALPESVETEREVTA